MSERTISLLLDDIKNAITAILQYTQNYSYDQYEADLKTRHAVERNFEIIGEAVSRVPENYKAVHPNIEWRILEDFRNFIIHDYFGINNAIVWETIQLRLRDLLSDINALLKMNKFIHLNLSLYPSIATTSPS